MPLNPDSVKTLKQKNQFLNNFLPAHFVVIYFPKDLFIRSLVYMQFPQNIKCVFSTDCRFPFGTAAEWCGVTNRAVKLLPALCGPLFPNLQSLETASVCPRSVRPDLSPGGSHRRTWRWSSGTFISLLFTILSGFTPQGRITIEMNSWLQFTWLWISRRKESKVLWSIVKARQSMVKHRNVNYDSCVV